MSIAKIEPTSWYCPRDLRCDMKGCDKMKVFGYCRISTRKQSIERQQLNILKAYPEADIYSEAYTGTTMARPEWNKLLKRVKPGDCIVFDSVSRMSRDSAEGWNTYQKLFNRGIELVFLKEHYCDTAVYKEAAEKQINIAATGDAAADELISGIAGALNTYMLRLAERQIQIAFDQSEKEVQDLRQRTKEGMAAHGSGRKIAEANTGKTYNSKAAAPTKEAILKYSKDFNGSLNDAEVIKLAGCSRNTYYKYKAQLKDAI